ncbi:MAG: kynureninase, partial [Gammaproteobacteria bacterium]
SLNEARWNELPLTTGRKLAPLVGAAPGELAVADSTSVNLFKMLALALQLRPDRNVIVTEAGNFPSDLYIIDGLCGLLERPVEVRRAAPDQLAGALDERTAVLCLTHVDYRSGRMHDMTGLTAAAHEAGALALWDLAHSAGAMPVDLDGAGADLAVGCGYKFLNGGPGAPAFLFVAERWQEQGQQPLTGWLGHARPFDFSDGFEPAPGIARNLCGTPPVLSMAALDAALDLFGGLDLQALRRKSEALGALLFSLYDQELRDFGFELVSPREDARRGSQVSLSHPRGYEIVQALAEAGVVGDFRAPDILRFGLAPLYQRYEDLWDAVSAVKEIMREERWREPRFAERGIVT